MKVCKRVLGQLVVLSVISGVFSLPGLAQQTIPHYDYEAIAQNDWHLGACATHEIALSKALATASSYCNAGDDYAGWDPSSAVYRKNEFSYTPDYRAYVTVYCRHHSPAQPITPSIVPPTTQNVPPARPIEWDFGIGASGFGATREIALSNALAQAREVCQIFKSNSTEQEVEAGLVDYDRNTVAYSTDRYGHPAVSISGFCKRPGSVRPDSNFDFTVAVDGNGHTREEALAKALGEASLACQTGGGGFIVRGGFNGADLVGYDHDLIRYTELDTQTFTAHIDLAQCKARKLQRAFSERTEETNDPKFVASVPGASAAPAAPADSFEFPRTAR